MRPTSGMPNSSLLRRVLTIVPVHATIKNIPADRFLCIVYSESVNNQLILSLKGLKINARQVYCHNKQYP